MKEVVYEESPELLGYWDRIAVERLKQKYSYSKECSICYEYMKEVSKLFLRGYLSPGKRRIFKSDLFEEGVDCERSFCAEQMENPEVFIAGLDISEVVVKSAEKNFSPWRGRFCFCVGDLHHIPYRSDYFDFVYSMSTVDHVKDPSMVMREFYRILKSGGLIYVSVPSNFSYYRIGQEFVARLFKGLDYGIWEKKFRREEIKSIIEGAGFKVRKIRKMILAPPYMHHLCRFRVFSWVLPPVYRLLLRLEDTPIGNIFGKEVMVIAEKP